MCFAGSRVTALVWFLGLAASSAHLYPAETLYVIASVAGSNLVGDGAPATAAQLGAAEGLALDAAGNLYIADNIDNRIRRVSASDGIITTLVGNGHTGNEGDGGPAIQALLNRPYGLAADAAGNLYIADLGNGRVRRVSPEGSIRAVAGGGDARPGQENGSALAARLAGPRNVAVDAADNLYISDFAAHRVYRVTPAGQITSVAGTGVAGYSGEGLGTSSRLNAPAGLAADRHGDLYIADSGNNRIRKLSGGQISTVLGGEALPGALSAPTGLAVDAAGNLYIADSGNNRVLRRSASGAVTVLTGGTLAGPVREVAADGLGNVYVAGGRWVRKIVPSGAVTTFAGDGSYGQSAEGAPASVTCLKAPISVAPDGMGNLYIAEEGGYRVRRVNPQGLTHTVAGTGVQGFSGDGGSAQFARLTDPVGVAADSQNAVWIADYQGNRIRRVGPNGIIQTIAGNGQPGFAGDNGPAAAAQLNRPRGLALDRGGSLYIADSLNHRVRRIDWNGLVFTVAGSGVRGYSGDGGAAAQAQLDTPAGVAVDAAGNLYIADSANHAVRKVTPQGFISTVAGTSLRAFGGDGGPATKAHLNLPTGVAVDTAGNLYIADSNNHRIRKVAPGGTIETIAGDGLPGFRGDGGPAVAARLRFPAGVAVDADGSVYVADLDNNRVRNLIPVSVPVRVEPLQEVVVANAASYLPGPVAPGQLVSILGAALEAKSAGSGVLAGLPGDTEARFSGWPAPLILAGPQQINVQVPYSLDGQTETELELYVNGALRSRVRLPVAAASPGIFTTGRGSGQAILVHEDGTLNSPENPAARGSLVTVYATGEGQTDPPGVDGRPAQPPLPKPRLPVSLRVGGLPAEILYAGSAPGFTGLLQINARLPEGFAPTGALPLTLMIGAASSQPGVTISVR